MTLHVDEVVLTGRTGAGGAGGAVGAVGAVGAAPFVVVEAGAAERHAVRRLRREVFVAEQGLFAGTDADDVDDDPRTRVLAAVSPDGEVLGGVRLHPALLDHREVGWWRGSRLVVAPAARRGGLVGGSGVGAALVRAACAAAETGGALRFDALVQQQNAVLFERLGWRSLGRQDLHGHPHVHVDWPVHRVQRLVDATKAALGGLLAEVQGGGPGFLGDDGAPVPGTDAVAACDAILPSMVERDPEWAGWCAVLVNLNDLAAMGAEPVGLLDALGARDASFARRVLRGLVDASRAWGVPVLGGHTQLGVPGSLSVTALGRTSDPVPGAGGRPGHALRLTADLTGGWRRGYAGSQWDSTTGRRPDDLRALGAVVARQRPAAAKDVSMAGAIGTAGMLAEASGCRAVLDVDAVPVPDAAVAGDWLTCFPGFAVLTADAPGTPLQVDLPDGVASRECGHLDTGSGVGLRWPDGVVTEAVTTVTGMGASR